jgi:hypothetical protein
MDFDSLLKQSDVNMPKVFIINERNAVYITYVYMCAF